MDKVENELNHLHLDQSQKRKDYISWDEYFMSIALLSSMRSKDPVTQVGACIINASNKIVGIGYNGMPNGLHDDEMPWGKKSSNELENKYLYVLNLNGAISNGCTIYTTLFPCNECAKVIIQTGIKEVVYLNDDKKGSVSNEASKMMFQKAFVKVRPFEKTGNKININFNI